MRKFLFGWIILFLSLSACAEIRQAVTYELSPGRFGDNLLSYIHAKWISYKYNIPLLYKRFVYSDRLVLHTCEPSYEENKKRFSSTVLLGHAVNIDVSDKRSKLYVVPYFPASRYELKYGISFSGASWYSFEIDWSDKYFIQELRKVIAPITPIARMNLPTNRITVAVHVRRGGNHDTPETVAAFPMKFLTDEFYITQINQLYYLLHEGPLYVYLFTDDTNPMRMMSMFQERLKGLDIQFDCRKGYNSDTVNVLEDFFALQQFDCLIHSESNYSLIMSKLGDYLVSIYPDSFRKINNTIVYDNINVSINRDHPKYNLLNFKKSKRKEINVFEN